MAVPELAVAHIRRFFEERTPADLRDQMRLEADVRGNAVTILDCRPPWEGSSGEWIRMRIAQLRFDPTSHQWSLHWADRNSRWHPYDDLVPTTLKSVLAEIDRDPTCIFFG